MNRKVEYLLPMALAAIDEVFDKEIAKNGIPSGYQAAASGFGVSLLQMGLLPTLAVYIDEGSGAEIERKKVLEVLLQIINKSKINDNQWNQLIADSTLLRFLAERRNDSQFLKELKEKLLLASVAFKLAIRTYKLS